MPSLSFAIITSGLGKSIHGVIVFVGSFYSGNGRWCCDRSFYIWGCCNRWVVMLPILRYTENLNWMNEYKGISTFQICTHAKASNVQCKLTQWTPHYLLHSNGSTECNRELLNCVTQRRWIYLLSARERLRLEREESATARLQHRHQRGQEN